MGAQPFGFVMMTGERVVQKPGLSRATYVDKGNDLSCIVVLSGAHGVQQQSDHLHAVKVVEVVDHLHEVKVVEPRAATHVNKESRLNSRADVGKEIGLVCNVVM